MGTARSFASNTENGRLIFGVVDRKDVFSTYLTGPGCAAENELVILGRNMEHNAVINR